MEDDEFDEEARHRGLVERWMKTDFSGLVVVDAEADGLAASTTRAPAPPYGSPHASLEMQLVERFENLLQVISTTPGREDLVARVAVLANARLLPANEVIEQTPGAPMPTSGVVGHRPHHRCRGIEKHVVQAQPKRRWRPAKAHHRAPVVRYRKPNWHAQLTGEQLRQRGRFFHEHFALREAVRGGRFELEQQELAG